MIGRRDYAERRAARIERLEARAAKARAEGEARVAGANRIASMIPLGQPILVGHHSERRARRDAERIRSGFAKGFERLNAADEFDRRAAAAESNTAISSDDPDAIQKLLAEIATEEAFRDRWKAISAAVRSGKPDRLAALSLTPDERQRLRFSECGTAYMTSNTSARIRRLRERLGELQSRSAAPEREPERYGSVTIEESENRVRIVFPGKPPGELRMALKRAGFRWSPTAGAWQRHASEQAWHAARSISDNRRTWRPSSEGAARSEPPCPVVHAGRGHAAPRGGPIHSAAPEALSVRLALTPRSAAEQRSEEACPLPPSTRDTLGNGERRTRAGARRGIRRSQQRGKPTDTEDWKRLARSSRGSCVRV